MKACQNITCDRHAVAQKDERFVLCPRNVHRMYLAGVLLAAKLMDDNVFNNPYWAKVIFSGMSTQLHRVHPDDRILMHDAHEPKIYIGKFLCRLALCADASGSSDTAVQGKEEQFGACSALMKDGHRKNTHNC